MHDLLYQHLSEFGIDRANTAGKQLSKLSEKRLTKLFDTYTDKAKDQRIRLPMTMGATDILPDSAAGFLEIDTAKQLALYVDRLFVHDPLLDWAEIFYHRHEFAKMACTPGERDRNAHFRKRFGLAINKLLKLKPLADCGMLHFIPSQMFLSSRKPGEIYLHDIFGPDGALQPLPVELPPALGQYFDKHLRVGQGRIENGNVVPTAFDPSSPRSVIILHLEGDPLPTYALLSTALPKNESAREGVVTVFFANQGLAPVDKDMFKHWVLGERNKFVRLRLDKLLRDAEIASALGATFLTPLTASRDILDADLGLTPGASSDKAFTAKLSMDLPYFEAVSVKEIAKARRNEEAFRLFQIELNKAFREIDGIADPQLLQKRVDEIRMDVLEAPLANISQRMHSLNRTVALGSSLLVGGLVGAIVGAGDTLLTKAIAGAAAVMASSALKEYATQKEKQETIRQLPAYFYWEATKKARKRELKERRKNR